MRLLRSSAPVIYSTTTTRSALQRGRSSTVRCFAATTTTIHQHAHGTVQGPHGSYAEEYAFSLKEPEKFWLRAAQKLEWFKTPTIAFEQDSTNPYMYRWFPDGVMNTCYNCLDVHCRNDENNRADQVALYYDSPLTGVKLAFTYQELLDQVSTFAGALQDLGVVAGDRVVIYMPMIPEAVIAMLACTRIGAVHSVVFGGFAAKELATRITDCQPKVIISASAGIEPTRIVPYKPLLDKALTLANVDSVCHTIIVQRTNVPDEAKCQLGPNDFDFHELMAKSSPVDAVPLPANHPHYILYTSGTTGLPKGVVRDTAGWATALKYSMGAFYDSGPGTVYWAASDIGWVVGHAYIVYAPLLNGCSTMLYEGKPVGTPDAGAFWRVIDEYKVRTLFVAPTAFRAIKQADPKAELVEKYDLSSLNAVFLAGEHSDPDTLHYCEMALSKYNDDVKAAIDHWWQTELGHPGVGNAIGLGRIPVRPGACAAPAPGFDIRVLDDNGRESPRGELGNMVIRTPLPPGTLQTLYKNDERYVQEYLTKYPGFYDTGDAALMDEDGYVHILGRTDDLINTAGHRLSTGTIEELLQSHPEVAECAVIPVKDGLKGEVPVGFVITNKGSTMEHDQLKKELIQIVRDDLGPIASFKTVGVVRALPKTRSGKILRSTMSKIANGQPYSITPTIEDSDIFNYLEPEIIKTVRGPR
jgi:propionyl-CoA synthetase